MAKLIAYVGRDEVLVTCYAGDGNLVGIRDLGDYDREEVGPDSAVLQVTARMNVS